MSKTISIVLIEDNRMLREGLASLIREQPGLDSSPRRRASSKRCRKSGRRSHE